VLKGVQKGMNLPQEHMLPSFATLRDYGNTSCSTTWYVMAYLESITGVSSGQKIMQVQEGGEGGRERGGGEERGGFSLLRSSSGGFGMWQGAGECSSERRVSVSSRGSEGSREAGNIPTDAPSVSTQLWYW
jgi:hypothetical protein